ncbi:MAG: hypothetical protein KDC45_09975 [Bacteroidetes bacterium]|nr:hypothetical protein [Bacteroidota bacterium]
MAETKQDKDQLAALERLMTMVQAPEFPGKLSPEHIAQFRSKICNFSESELLVVTQKIEEEIDKKQKSGKTLLVSKLEDIAALTKMEVMLGQKGVPEPLINMLLSILVNKSSNFAVPIFEGKLNELYNNSVENAVINIVLEKAASKDDGFETTDSQELKELFEKKIRDTETLTHLIKIIDQVDLNQDQQIKSVFIVNLLAEAMKRDETMRKSESITMKDMINTYLLSKLQMRLAEYNYPNDTLEGILINRLGQSNNIKRQFRILDSIIESTLSGDLDIELGSKTEKLEWLQLLNELEVDVALQQYDEKLAQDNYSPLDESIKNEIRKALSADNIADQTIAAISFARRLDNPDESLHEAQKLTEIARETQYLTSMIFKIKGFQIREVYEFVELIGELDVKKTAEVVEYFKYELPCIDKAVLKEEDAELKKAALSSRYLSARLMSKFHIDPSVLNLSHDYLSVDVTKLGDRTVDEFELNRKVSDFNELRKRLSFFNRAERAFLAMNHVEALIDKNGLSLDQKGVFKILDLINDVELGLAIAAYVKEGIITKGQGDGDNFNAKYVETKFKALFKTESIRLIEKEAVEKNIIPESVLSKAEEDGNFEETLLDVKNYATYLVTRRFDKPEYPRHTQRALNLVLALIQDAIGWRHFENTQIRAKREVMPLIEEYFRFFNKLLAGLEGDKDKSHEEVISKLRDDDFFAITDNKDSVEAGKKSAPQVKSEFMSLMGDERFQTYTAQAIEFAKESTVKDWVVYRTALETIKAEVMSSMDKTLAVILGLVEKLKSDTKHTDQYAPYIDTLQNRYFDQIKRLRYQLETDRKPSTIVKIEYDRIANSEKFKVFLKHTFELTKEA